MNTPSNKGHFVAEIQAANSKVQGIFLVEEKNILETKNGAPYAALVLSDRTGKISARIWEDGKSLFDLFEKGDFLFIKGEGAEFRGAVQVRILEVARIDADTVDIRDFMPHTAFSIDDMWKELMRYKREIKDPELRSIIHAIFDDHTIGHLFRRAPAAKKMHHACIGGLLEHTLSVVRLAKFMLKNYPWLKRDLLIAGAILHDIGKIEEFSFDRPPIEYTDKGRLLGHLVIGANIIERFSSLVHPKGTTETVRLLTHMVLSHHGQREFGSPVLPMTEEALVLHLMDDLDAKLNFMQGLKDQGPASQYKWTDYQALLGRYFFLPGLDQAVPPGDGPDESAMMEGEDPIQSPMLRAQKDLWK